MPEVFNAAQRRANQDADAVLHAAGAPTYSTLRRLLDESARALSVLARSSASVPPGLIVKLGAAVPSFDGGSQYAPRLAPLPVGSAS